MPRYNLTIERASRVMIEFEADNDDLAQQKANELNEVYIMSDRLDKEDPSYDYALCEEDGRTVLDWN